ncbi:MAG: hypothetical protein FE039_00545 [Thermoplasmata archaeon]|nr:MAG: hypothetical protein FE039_00545 [Thermoplasmata archaeon]
MTDNMLIGVSPDYLYFQGKPPKKVSDFHRPYFLVFTPPGLDIKNARSSLLKKLEENKSDQNPLSRIKSVGEIETYNSFWDFNKEIPVFKVFTEKSYQVPEVSDHLFFDYNLYTAEHDIPYQQRALVDLAVDKGFWLFNTNGFVKKLRVLVYDIETTEFSEGKEDIPIDMIGFSDFEVKINSKASLSSEDFSFDIVDIPSTWEDIEVEQVVSHNVDEEIDNLYVFCKKLHSFDIISGHNIIGFDNYLIYNRVKWLLKNYLKVLSPEKIKVFQSFISRFSRPDNTFHFGVHSEAVQFYPCSFDTYHGARKFYSFLDDFSLKSVAPFLGVEVKNRIILTPSQIKIDNRTLKYNKQDVQEQLGVTLNLIQQALPLCFTTCMPFDMLLTSGAVSMWDHMSLIRSKLQKKIMPPTCRVLSISQTLTKYFKGCSSKEDIVKKAKSRREQLSKDFIRVLKYGEEMPPWVEDPYIIFNEQAKDSDDVLNYHMPGGMTIKPDKDANSHFIPWYYVVVADVGAMYPTILKALNIGADTVCLAKKDETPDDFIWLKKIPLDFLKKRSIWYRNVTEQDVFADKGYILGVKIDKKPGVVNCSMTGIMNMISRVKKELKQTSKTGDKKELYRLKMMYQSLKGARNAGTHGILSAPTVSGRQFNLWGAAAITTKGQMILSDTLNYLQKKKVRVVYGDSVDSDTDVIIKENNLVKIVNIKELFSQCNSKLYKKDGHEYKTLSNIKCLSINKNGICEWKKANFIKRHPYNGNILKVRTQRGEISVTMNHSLYTISNGLKEVFCRDIKNKNVNIVHVSKYNSKGRKIKINALKPLLKFNNELNIWLNIPLNSSTKRLLKYHQPRNNSKGKNTYKKFVRMPISKAIQLYKNGIIRDRDIQNAFISSYNGVGKIPVIYEFDEDFARILGAYAAEGSIYIRKRKGMTKEGAHIFVCGHNVELLHKLKRILEDKFKKKFRITSAGIDKNGENFRIQGNSSTTYLFKFVLDCGQGCRNKKVSPYVLSASKNVQKAFIDEYAKGDGYYETKRRVNPLLGIQTKSKKLVEGLSFLGINTNYGFPSVTYRKEKSAYHLRFVQYNKYSKRYKNLTGLIPKTIMEIKPTDGYVYDISVQNNNNFVCANGLIPAHNTDGIYLGCSKSAGNIPNLAKALGLSIEKNEKDWVSKPDVVLESIGECNNRWRKELNYSDFELEPEVHDAMIFVKHKNYLIFDNRDDEIEMITKGNNFKGSDKANIARKVLKQIMMEVLRENPRWDDEEEVRKNVKLSIMEKTNEIVSRLDLKKVDIEDLTLVQSVQPAKRYKLNQDGSMSTFGKRAAALEKLLGQPIRTRVKLKFVVTKQPLPGIKNPSKSGVKPIDYMYPVDLLEDKSQIDLDWYKKMIENYVAGAFGLSNVTVTEQKGLDAWM